MNGRSMHRLLLLCLAAYTFTGMKAGSTTESALVINEIMPANVDMFLDPSFNYGNWIELYNGTGRDINLANYYLSDDESNTTMCSLGSTTRTIKAGGYLTLWFGHKDDYCQQQVEFSLDSDGGDIILSDKKGNVISAVSYPSTPARISWARKTNGGSEWGDTGQPTPGASNSTSQFAQDQLPAPEISVDSKLFTGQFTFNVTIPQGATLYYTKDGSTPTPDNPNVKTSSGSHTVNDTKIYRFRLYQDGMLPSPVVTRSYIMTSNKYGVPIVSIVTANDNLYSTEYGLWAKGPNGKTGNGQSDKCNWNRDWDRPVNVEIFDSKGSMLINQEAEITPSGRYSRSFEPRPFKLQAKKKYGYDNYFAFTPFTDKPYNKYKTLKLRGGGNNYQSRLKDAALQQIIIRSGLNIDCQSYQPVHHYINGVYKGIINIREPNNKDFAYSNYGFDEDEVDCFKLDHNNGNGGFTVTEGSRDAWDEWVQLSKTAAQESSYQRICEIVDIDEFINYMAVEMFLFNQDWPRNNIKAFRYSPDGRFRFVVFDLDHAFGSVNSATDVNPFTFFDTEEYYSNGGYKSAMVTLFHNMLANDTFCKQFVSSFLIVANCVFETTGVNSTVKELATRAEKEMAFKGESPWADANLITNTLTTDYRDNRINQLINWSKIRLESRSLINKRVTTNIKQAELTYNGVIVPNSRLTGKVFCPATVKVTTPGGYKFIGWKDRKDSIVSTNPEYVLNTKYEVVTAYFVPDSTRERPIRINEVSANNKVFVNESFKKSDWIELYNTTSDKMDLGGMMLSDKLSQPDKYVIPQGTTIPAHGYLIIWCDNETGEQLHAPFKLDNKQNNAVVLTAGDYSWADTLQYTSHTGFQSVGLYPDGGSTAYIMNRPSIAKANNRSSYDQIDDSNTTTVIRTISVTKNDDVIYNLLGQPVTEPQSGQMYIKNGRKYIYCP